MTAQKETATHLWLRTLFGKSPGFFTVIVFVKGQPHTKWYRTSAIDRVAPQIEEAAEKYDVYCSVATYKAKPEKGRGSLKDVGSISGFWADLDIGSEGHKPAQHPNPETELEALSIIKDMPDATAVIHSGGGLQVWWLFDKPWVFDDPVDAQRASNEWQNRLVKSGESLGYHVDKVGDLPRILRIPGTQNHKTDNARPVVLENLNDTRHPAEVLASIGEPDEKPGKVPAGLNTWEAILEPHQWTKAGIRPDDGATMWRRPGKKKSEGISAVTDPYHAPVMVNFSSSTILPVGPGKRLTKFKVWAYLNHDGDMAAAKVEWDALNNGRRVVLTSMDSIKPRPVFWLWKDRLPLGNLGLLAGREGTGKSTLAYTLIADITRGKLPGKYFGIPKAVIVCATEDSYSQTIAPRLKAANADMSRVYKVEVMTTENESVVLSLPGDLKEVERVATEVGAVLLLLDPLISRLGKLDTHKDAEVRQALEPLAAMADRTGMAVLGIIHHNKSGSTDPLQLVMGSAAFAAVARSVHTVIPDTDDDTGKRRMIYGTTKNNLGRSDLPSLAFTIVGYDFDTDEGQANTGRLVWGEETAFSIGDTMRRSAERNGVRNATDRATDWLGDYLALHEGHVSSADVKEDGAQAGHARGALDRARALLKLEVSSGSEFPRKTYWDSPVAQSVPVPV